MRRILFLLLVAMLALFMIVSCDGQTPGPDQEQTEGPSNPGGGDGTEIPEGPVDPSGMLKLQAIGEDVIIVNCDASAVDVVIPDGVTEIGYGAFDDCSELVSIIIPDSVTRIDDLAFSYCQKLENITMSDNVSYIGGQAFQFCESLTSIELPNALTAIEYCAFESCTNLKNITIPNGVKTIGERVFDNCTSLTDITIPDSVTEIGSGAFSYSGLKTISLPQSLNDEYEAQKTDDLANWAIPEDCKVTFR